MIECTKHMRLSQQLRVLEPHKLDYKAEVKRIIFDKKNKTGFKRLGIW